MLTRRRGAACETAQNSAEERQPDRPATLIVRFDRERQKLSSAMQLVGVKHRLYTSTWPLIVDIGRRGTQAGHLGVVAYLEVERAGSAAVGPRHEQQCVALCAEFVVGLLDGDGVDGCLDLARRHAGVKTGHVRSEVRLFLRSEVRFFRVNQTAHANRKETIEKNKGGNPHRGPS